MASEATIVLPGLALALGSGSPAERARFAAIGFRGLAVRSAFEGRADDAAALMALRSAAVAPVVTAQRSRVEALLREASVDPLPPVWDLLELAALLEPALGGADLDGVVAHAGLEREEPGPEGDVRLLIGLFGRLVERLANYDAPTLAAACRLAAPLDWPLRSLLLEVERQRSRVRLGAPSRTTAATEEVAPPTPGRRRAGPIPRERPRPLDEPALLRLLGPDGALAAALPGYEPRQVQAHMALAVARAIDDGGRLLVEAGTGTGKSLAYLLPAAQASLRNGWRVVVSTATTTLQDQLFGKDLPTLRAALGDDRLRAAVLKGRGNYLCRRRWEAMLHADDLRPAERSLLLKTLFWLPRTERGDRAELRLTPAEAEAWQRVNAAVDECTPLRCAYHRAGLCYLARARRAAEESHLVIVNHALLLSDLAAGSRVLPPYQVLVMDEVHHLEDEATSQLGWRLRERDLQGHLERLWGEMGVRGPSGLLPSALAALGAADGGAPGRRGGGRRGATAAEAMRIERAVAQAGRGVRAYFRALADLAREAGAGDDESAVRLSDALRSGSAWQAIEADWSGTSARLLEVAQTAMELAERLAERGGDERALELAALLTEEGEWWLRTRESLDTATHLPARGYVYWLGGGRGGPVYVAAAPLDVSDVLRHALFEPCHAVVGVSATLAVDGSFRYVQQRLGLDDATTLALGSSFDFASAALLYAAHDLPDPGQPGYQAAVERVLAETITTLGGRTLVLFTSRAHLRATFHALQDRLAARGISLLGQGVQDDSRTHLLERFRRDQRVALFGTSSFWEGVDVAGEALSCVVLVRLPFAVPSDPVFAARAEQYDDPFDDYAVPHAVLRFKQGFGRLIRSRTDRGVVLVLDRRLVTRRYGQVFTRSLPPCAIRQGPATRSAAVAAEWLRGAPLPAATPESDPSDSADALEDEGASRHALGRYLNA